MEMKAARFHSPGGPEVLVYEEVPDPVPSDREVIVRVKACGVNRLDVWVRNGRYKTSLPHIPGTDVAGTVEQMGEGVRKFTPGDRVIIYPVMHDGTCRFCIEGNSNQCMNIGLLGAVNDGGYAELLRVKEESVMKIDDLDFNIAASLPVNFATAWNGLVDKAKVGPDDYVLIWGASSGLGNAALQIAKMHGSKVIVTAGNDEKLRRAKEVGADYVINHSDEDVAERVKEITAGIGADVVFDHVGGETWPASLASLRKGGLMLTAGATAGSEVNVDVPLVYRNELRVAGVYAFTYYHLWKVVKLAKEKKLNPIIDSKFKLSEARKAHERLESRQHFGKIILNP